jgi:Tol biopolymer transport system component
MRVLVCLARRPGEVFSREQLLAEVWGDVVVQEEALTHAISRLRRAFGDDARSARYIETILKSGYRLIAPVESEAAPAAGAAGPRSAAREGRRVWLIAAAMLLAVLAAAFWPRRGSPRLALLEDRPLTSQPGEELMPALSPDGSRIAFVRDANAESGLDLYVQSHDAVPLQLTSSAADDRYPCWSPTGERIAFVRFEETASEVRVVAALGGEERRVFETERRAAIRGIDWHPLAERLVLSARLGPEEPWTLVELEVESGEVTPLLQPPSGFRGDFEPVYSPDGTRVAFLRGDRIGFTNVHVAEVRDTDGSHDVRALTVGLDRIRGLDWLAGGEAIVFSSGTAFAGEFRLWRVDVETRERTWLPTRGRRAIQPSVARSAGTLAYGEETYQRHLARLPIPPGANPEPLPLARSSQNDFDPHFSPSGERIAFVSTRSGHPEVHVARRDGSGARAVTSFEGATPEFVRWSPDEEKIAYIVAVEARLAVHVTDVESCVTRPLLDSDLNQVLLSWARDGEHLYLRVLEADGWRTLRVALETGESEELFPFGAYMLGETQDGASLLYAKPGVRGVMRSARDGSAEALLFSEAGMALDCYWKVGSEGVFFYRRVQGRTLLAFHDLAAGETLPLLTIPDVPWRLLDVALDGSSLLLDVVDSVETDLMLVESPAGAE